MKSITNKVISCVLAMVTAFTMCVTVKKFEPLTVQAAAEEEFLSEVALVYENSVEAAKKAIIATAFFLINAIICVLPESFFCSFMLL